ncbi:MAG TPA: LuxR C-terminal-related transcriptional regulator [Pirellulales bacterium]|jgi:DNA-binding NarL/FixJ family response regulator
MAARPAENVRHEASIPPLFGKDEWTTIMRRLALSPRQAEIMGLILQSRKDKEIAATLDISYSTVRTYLEEMKQRLAVPDRMGLAYRVFWTFRNISEPKRYPCLHAGRPSDNHAK